MSLEAFYRYKTRLMEAFVTNPAIVKLLNEDIEITNAKRLIYQQVYPYEYIPETVEFGQTFICVDVDIQSVTNNLIMKPDIFIWVFTHKSLLRLPEGGVRVDQLCSEIDTALNGNRFFGMGELKLASCKRFAPTNDYQGKVMRFVADEINHDPDIKHRVPANRKEPGKFYGAIVQ